MGPWTCKLEAWVKVLIYKNEADLLHGIPKFKSYAEPYNWRQRKMKP